MINLNPKFKIVKKDRWFYDRFEYCLSFCLDEISCLRELSHENIDEFIQRRRIWREITLQRQNKYSVGNILTRRTKPITDETVNNLHVLAEILLNSPSEYKLVVSVDYGWIYSNDLKLLSNIDSLDFLQHRCYTRAQVTRAKDTVQLKKSNYKFRSYFRAIKLTAQQKDHLMDFLYNQRDQVRVSSALQRWIDLPFNRVQDYFFVDHSTENWLTMLSLVQPGLIRKTMQITTAK